MKNLRDLQSVSALMHLMVYIRTAYTNFLKKFYVVSYCKVWEGRMEKIGQQFLVATFIFVSIEN